MNDKRNREPSFSLHEFRSWLAKQSIPKMDRKKATGPIAEGLIGKLVESRLGQKRLEKKIAEANTTDKADILAEDFKSNGGKIVRVNNNLCVEVEVASGNFVIPKIYTKVKENK